MKRTIEERQNLTEDDVRTRLKELSAPMLQQEYLENLLKRLALQPSIKVFASKNLTDLYIRRGLWGTAAKVLENAADAATVFSEKKSIYMNVGSLYIKAMEYLLADDAFRKAVEAASPGEKAKLTADIRGIFLREAEALDNDGKIAKAVKLYERILRSASASEEKKKVMTRLMVLYDKLARISDSFAMRESLKNFK
jgi:tetratricopeptide (TPR) repeat protein